MRECAYDSAFMFKYSERPGTYASKHLPDDVPEEVKIRRLNEIIELQNRLSAESNARDVGKTFEVMVEGVSKRSREDVYKRQNFGSFSYFNRLLQFDVIIVKSGITQTITEWEKTVSYTHLGFTHLLYRPSADIFSIFQDKLSIVILRTPRCV